MLSHMSGSGAHPTAARPVAQRQARVLSSQHTGGSLAHNTPSSQQHAVRATATRPAGGSLSTMPAKTPTTLRSAAAARPAGGSFSISSASRPTVTATSKISGGSMQARVTSAVGTAAAYAQPTAPAYATSALAASAYAEPTALGGMNLLRPTGPRTNPNNLLAGGRVIEERVVDINELLATGKLIEAPPVRDQAFRSSTAMVSGLAAAPIATPVATAAPMYGNVEYITEAVAGPTMVTEFAAPTMTTEFVAPDVTTYAAPVTTYTAPVTEVFLQ